MTIYLAIKELGGERDRGERGGEREREREREAVTTCA